MELHTLQGNFDLLLTSACTMSCKGCTYLDYKDMGCTIGSVLKMDDVRTIVENLKKINIKLQTITLLGGEPTLHPNYLDIVKYLHEHKNVVYNKLRVISNGTFLKEDFIRSLDFIDTVRFSIYPNSKDIETNLHATGLYEFIKSKCRVVLFNYTYFSKYGEEQENIEYSQQLNWDRCIAKDRCRVLTTDGIYRCYVAYNSKTEICDYSDRLGLINYIENKDTPLDKCTVCPMPCKTEPWQSNNDTRDSLMVESGVGFIQKWRDYIES